MMVMVMVSFSLITNYYKPSTIFLLVAALGAAMLPFSSWVAQKLVTITRKRRSFDSKVHNEGYMAQAHYLSGVVDEHYE